MCSVLWSDKQVSKTVPCEFHAPPTPGYADSRTSGWKAEGGFAFPPLTSYWDFQSKRTPFSTCLRYVNLKAKRSLSCCKTIFAVPQPVSMAAFHLDRSDPAPPGGLSQGFINYVIISTRFRALITVWQPRQARQHPFCHPHCSQGHSVHTLSPAEMVLGFVVCLFIHLFASEAGFFQGDASRANKQDPVFV